QIVQYDQCQVQSGDLNFNSGQGSLSATVTSIDPAKSWLMYSTGNTGGTVSNIGEDNLRGLVTNATTITLDRSLTTGSADLTWYLVTFTDATTVQNGSQPLSTTELLKNVALSPINLGASLAAAGYLNRGGRCNYTIDDNMGTAWAQ